MMSQGRLDPNNQAQFIATMTGALAAAPQISALSFIDTANQRTTIIRTFEGTIIETKDETGSLAMRRTRELADASAEASWGEPLYLPDPQVTIAVRSVPTPRFLPSPAQLRTPFASPSTPLHTD